MAGVDRPDNCRLTRANPDLTRGRPLAFSEVLLGASKGTPEDSVIGGALLVDAVWVDRLKAIVLARGCA
jgi:hypothetical protein